ncbi:MAG: hypothetical protein FWD89_02805 [Firmicutes bacterium]|nr:hypothetical protein [Bacillota bacterium]MCL2771220.1 hypothetical protein [Bacillota bacterium]
MDINNYNFNYPQKDCFKELRAQEASGGVKKRQIGFLIAGIAIIFCSLFWLLGVILPLVISGGHTEQNTTELTATVTSVSRTGNLTFETEEFAAKFQVIQSASIINNTEALKITTGDIITIRVTNSSVQHVGDKDRTISIYSLTARGAAIITLDSYNEADEAAGRIVAIIFGIIFGVSTLPGIALLILFAVIKTTPKPKNLTKTSLSMVPKNNVPKIH